MVDLIIRVFEIVTNKLENSFESLIQDLLFLLFQPLHTLISRRVHNQCHFGLMHPLQPIYEFVYEFPFVIIVLNFGIKRLDYGDNGRTFLNEKVIKLPDGIIVNKGIRGVRLEREPSSADFVNQLHLLLLHELLRPLNVFRKGNLSFGHYDSKAFVEVLNIIKQLTDTFHGFFEVLSPPYVDESSLDHKYHFDIHRLVKQPSDVETVYKILFKGQIATIIAETGGVTDISALFFNSNKVRQCSCRGCYFLANFY